MRSQKIPLGLLILFALGLATACSRQVSQSAESTAEEGGAPAAPVDVPFETSFIEASAPAADSQPQSEHLRAAVASEQDSAVSDAAGQLAQVTAQDPNSQVNVRSLPSQTAASIGYGLVGDTVQLGRSDLSEDGHTWYSVTFLETPVVGWIRSDFLDIQAAPLNQADSLQAGAPAPSAADLEQDALKAALDQQCGSPDAIRAYFVTQQHTIYVCEARRKLRYLSQEHGTQQVIVADTVQAAGGGYLIENGNFEYRLDASGFVIVRMDEAGKAHPVLKEPIIYSERY